MPPSLMKAVKDRLVSPSSPAAIRERIAELDTEKGALTGDLDQLRHQLGEILVDRPTEAADHRARRRNLEDRLEEVDAMLEALRRRLVQAEASERESAFQTDVTRWRALGDETRRCEVEYSQAADTLTAVLRQMATLHREGKDIERRAEQAGRRDDLFASNPQRPGCTSKGLELFDDESLQRIPRLGESHGFFYNVKPPTER